jgi:hypothetical protein
MENCRTDMILRGTKRSPYLFTIYRPQSFPGIGCSVNPQ